MSDIQIALLILGLTIILFMIIFNWIQLKKTRAKQKKTESMHRQKDPLFDNGSNNPPELDDYIVHDPINQSVSKEFLKKNLPDEINMDFESVVSLTLNKTSEAGVLLNLNLTSYLQDLRLSLYLRKDNDLWATGDAIDESFTFDQILLSLPLISRKLDITENVKQNFLDFIEKIREQLEVNQIWLSNEDIVERADELKTFKTLINKNFLVKIQPKTDSSFHFGAFQDFFNKVNIRVFKDFHWYFDPKVDGQKMFKIMNLNRQPLRIESDAFIQGIIVSLDIPATANSLEAFEEMVNLMNEFCIKLNAVMVDGRNKEIDSVYVASIKNHMNQIVKEMEKHNLTPGSQQAQKYFV
tara:strand:+ start:16691 stop:17749 length:1059 start_codon:yes stop_codon:yes gene_type:complete